MILEDFLAKDADIHSKVESFFVNLDATKDMAELAGFIIHRVRDAIMYNGLHFASSVFLNEDEDGAINVEFIFDDVNVRAGIVIECELKNSTWWFIAMGNGCVGNMQSTGLLYDMNIDAIISGLASVLNGSKKQ